MRILTALSLMLALAACQSDETVTAYGGAGVWQLQSIDDQPFLALATMDLSTPGRLAGSAPCNSYFAPQTAPYPWFSPGPIAASKRACADLAAESAFFQALSKMTFAEVVGDTLLLSRSDGGGMVFTRAHSE